jgi:four helix bundle protein
MNDSFKGGFEELEVWKEARSFRRKISEDAGKFPIEEKYKLIDQVLRSSRSVHNNISEGYGRFHYQENIQFCRQARGSLMETMDHLICAFDENYIDAKKLADFREKYSHILRLLNGYISYLEKRKKSGK